MKGSMGLQQNEIVNAETQIERLEGPRDRHLPPRTRPLPFAFGRPDALLWKATACAAHNAGFQNGRFLRHR